MGRGPRSGARRGRGAGRGGGQRRQPCRHPAAPGLLQPAARRLPLPRPGVLRQDRRARSRRLRLGRRRPGVRAARGRRLRREGRRTGRAAAARPRGRGPHARRGAARGRLHRLVQRVHGRPSASGRDAAGARRLQRHRHHGDPARQGRRRQGRGDGRDEGEARPLRRAGRGRADQLPRSGLRRRDQAGHRGRGRRRHPRQHGCEVPGPQCPGARRQRTPRDHRHAGRCEG